MTYNDEWRGKYKQNKILSHHQNKIIYYENFDGTQLLSDFSCEIWNKFFIEGMQLRSDYFITDKTFNHW